MRVFPLFEHDNHDHAVPRLTEASAWAIQRACLLTIKLDGQNVKVQDNQLYRKMAADAPGAEPYYVLCSQYIEEDKPLMQAYVNAAGTRGGVMMPNGIYEAFGPGINGNPHGAEEPYMLRIAPMDGPLIVQAGCQVKSGWGVSPQELYDTLKAELAESPEIEGFVFQWEEKMMEPKLFAAVNRVEFGLAWPTNLTGASNA